MEERWITKKEISNFIDTLNNFAEKNDKDIQLYLFGGSALILHGLREKTSDFDSIMLVDGKLNPSINNEVKPICLNSIGLYSNSVLYENTFNDLSSLPETVHARAMEYHQKNYEKYEFESRKVGNLILNFPSKKYLLTSRLIDLITNNPKTDLDKVDAQILIKNLGINQKNKTDFINSINNSKKEQISIILDNLLEITEYSLKASSNIENIRKNNQVNPLEKNINNKI